MQFSAFKGPFEERIEAWNHKLFIIGEVLDKWLEARARRPVSWCGWPSRRVHEDGVVTRQCSAQVQRNWMYLQPIFESPDINKQLPAEGKKFATVNKNWCATVTAAKARPVPTQRVEVELELAAMASTRRHAAVAPSTRPRERLHVA